MSYNKGAQSADDTVQTGDGAGGFDGTAVRKFSDGSFEFPATTPGAADTAYASLYSNEEILKSTDSDGHVHRMGAAEGMIQIDLTAGDHTLSEDEASNAIVRVYGSAITARSLIFPTITQLRHSGRRMIIMDTVDLDSVVVDTVAAIHSIIIGGGARVTQEVLISPIGVFTIGGGPDPY